MTNGDYIRSLDNRGLSVMLGVITDEFTKSAISDPTYFMVGAVLIAIFVFFFIMNLIGSFLMQLVL